MANGVYILRTIKTTVNIDGWIEECAPYFVWRVGYLRGIDDYNFYQENEPYNVGAYLSHIFGASPVFRTEDEASLFALKLSKRLKKSDRDVYFLNTDLKFFSD